MIALLILFAIWIWLGIGFVLLTFQNPKLDNGLQSIIYMAAWPWFLFKG